MKKYADLIAATLSFFICFEAQKIYIVTATNGWSSQHFVA